MEGFLREQKELGMPKGCEITKENQVTIGHPETKNQSSMMEVILVGLTSFPGLQRILFGAFTCIYATAIVGNLLVIFIIWKCKKLHTPMYFLLINLSFVNVFSITITTPKLLQTLLGQKKTISLYGCITQMFFFIWTLAAEILLLSFMAFDRYAAICHPLQYIIIMRKEVCIGVAAAIWVVGMINSAIHAGLLLRLPLCSPPYIINHFYCDYPPLLKLFCSDTSLDETMTFVAALFFACCSCGLTVISYCFIVRAICRIRSTEGKKKAFSTCSSHLIVVSFFFSSVIYTYTRPASVHSQDKIISLFYSVLNPVFNPIIYSLKNKDFKEALMKTTGSGRLLQRLQINLQKLLEH
ncbi:olfactory receptor 13G1-like [Hemicordylus capensis]|uniref:olfactory receptor 13G1-like n=1 Tax=Hemicordylus capensis TaxID=884348 RepID=UPI002303C054|nr:olfactory receptor 13G1-like [Hemicordylus capensis]